MSKAELIRAYLIEPTVSALALSLLINWLGASANSNFMHDEARDILSLAVVLLGASLALWIGLFWISSSEFGQWLASKGMLKHINAAYIASTVTLLSTCVLCILCAHVPATTTWLQIAGEFLSIWGLLTMPTLLNNTRHLLRLHGLFASQPRPVTEIKSSLKQS
jgi:ABC-type multidrug transport system permease subunit